MMFSEAVIRALLAKFLSNDIPLDVFEDQLVSNSWNVHQHGSEPAQRLVSAIELRLAEHSAGHLDEERLRVEMHDLLRLVPVVSSSASTATSLHASNVTRVALGAAVAVSSATSSRSAKNVMTERRELETA